jgi:hypothetical protein
VRNKIAPQEIFTEAIVQNRNKHYHGTDGTGKPVGTGTCRMVDGNEVRGFFSGGGGCSELTLAKVISSQRGNVQSFVFAQGLKTSMMNADLLNGIIWLFGAASCTTISGVICSTYRCAKHHELRR